MCEFDHCKTCWELSDALPIRIAVLLEGQGTGAEMNIPPCYVHFPKWKRQLDKVTLDVPVNPRFQDVVHPVVISPPQSFTCCIGGDACLHVLGKRVGRKLRNEGMVFSCAVLFLVSAFFLVIQNVKLQSTGSVTSMEEQQ